MKSKEGFIRTALIVALLVLLAGVVAIILKGWLDGHFDSFASFRQYIASFGIWGPVVLTLIQALQVVIPILPGFLGCIVGGALFGWLGGFVVNYIGISAGSIAAYYLARRYGIKLVSKLINMDKYQDYIEKINKSKSYTVLLFLSILLPLAPDDFLCYFSGLINMSPKKYNTIILVAKPWCILVYSVFFAYYI